MKKLVFLIALISLTFSAFAQEQNSEPMKKVVVVARLSIKAEKVDKFLQAAEKIVNETRKEDGCKTYVLYKSSFKPENEFIFYEEYQNQKALDFHNNSEHLKEFFAAITSLLEGAPMVEVY